MSMTSETSQKSDIKGEYITTDTPSITIIVLRGFYYCDEMDNPTWLFDFKLGALDPLHTARYIIPDIPDSVSDWFQHSLQLCFEQFKTDYHILRKLKDDDV